MKIFIVDDNVNIVKILEKIIYDKELGEVVGKAYNGAEALEKIEAIRPDIVLLDFLMPSMDGISLLKEIKKKHPGIQYIMISEVSSKELISKAYNNGIEFFISKPIDAVEVQAVIKNVISKLEMNKKLEIIQGIFSEKEKHHVVVHEEDNSVGIKRVLQRLGILSESGSQDIVNAALYLIEKKQSTADITIIDLCGYISKENSKIVEQRMRRAAAVGMKNIAHIGIEDYMNEIFTEYSNGLYNFEQIKIEMDYNRGKSKKRGKVNLKKFIDGIIYYGKMENDSIS